jgi:hypothetical protein
MPSQAIAIAPPPRISGYYLPSTLSDQGVKRRLARGKMDLTDTRKRNPSGRL